MKKINFLSWLSLPILLLLMSACGSEQEISSPNEKGMAHLSFVVSNYLQVSLPELSEQSTRAAAVSVLAHLAVGVFDAEGECQQMVIQNKGDEGYGNFSMDLPYGDYTFVFVGYDGSHAVQMSSPTSISFADNYVPNCFLRTLPLKVNATTTVAQSVTLSRCVACFTVECSKGIPTTMKAMQYKTEGGGTVLNALTGLAAATVTRQGSIDFSNVTKPTEVQKLNIYAFLPESSCTMQFDLSAVDADGGVLASRSFKDVPMKINQQTYYSGDFFADDPTSSALGFTLMLENTEWDRVDYTY